MGRYTGHTAYTRVEQAIDLLAQSQDNTRYWPCARAMALVGAWRGLCFGMLLPVPAALTAVIGSVIHVVGYSAGLLVKKHQIELAEFTSGCLFIGMIYAIGLFTN